MTADEVSLAATMQGQLQDAMDFEGSSEEKKAVLSHNTRVVELLSFIELQYRTGYAKPVQYLHPCR